MRATDRSYAKLNTNRNFLNTIWQFVTPEN